MKIIVYVALMSIMAPLAKGLDLETIISKISREADDVPALRRAVLREAVPWARALLHNSSHVHRTGRGHGKGPSAYPFFGWIPQPVTSMSVGGGSVTWASPCFRECSAQASATHDGAVSVQMSFQGAEGVVCEDFYALATVTHLHFFTVSEEGDVSVEYAVPSDANEAELWDIETKGLRILRLPHDRSTTLFNLAETILLFESEFTQGVTPRVAERNIRFVETYTEFRYPSLTQQERRLLPVPDESEVASGDFFGIVRLDGLDPMLAWGMGSTTGHTTVALWVDGELFICESTTKDAYWPTDGVQRTPYRQWLKQAAAAGYNTVWAPLSDEHRSRFNETAAIEWFKTVEGLEYGYQTLLWGWIDTAMQNYPCLPDDNYTSNCLTWTALEPVFAAVDRRLPKIADLMWIEAWNKRLGVTGQRTAQLYQTAASQGLDSSKIPTIVEQDDWLYQTKRFKQPAVGRAMVCCVFVCSMWKHAGVLGDTPINCGELTNYDDYSLKIFAGNYTQITGSYRLSLNDFNTRPLVPDYAEACPGQPPSYDKPEGC